MYAIRNQSYLSKGLINLYLIYSIFVTIKASDNAENERK